MLVKPATSPFIGSADAPHLESMVMAWKTPKIVEVALGAEINCYACAELPA
jgi:coenzyme PQQ precursor peptide PqqA